MYARAGGGWEAVAHHLHRHGRFVNNPENRVHRVFDRLQLGGGCVCVCVCVRVWRGAEWAVQASPPE